jgi:3-isopropylmalate/(R)-2-methylmalate dehydratase small subunit
MEPVTRIRSRTIVMNQSDVDTDQIIPARFLTTTTRKGLGKALFADWRYTQDGKPKPDFLLNRAEAQGCGILVAGNNFGCGSSREHAPWALLDYGIRAVISTEIADIFRGNSLKNGLVPVVIDGTTHGWLLANPGVTVEIDVEATELRLPNQRAIKFPLDGFSRYCLLNGVDQLGYLLKQTDAIERFERQRSWQP